MQKLFDYKSSPAVHHPVKCHPKRSNQLFLSGYSMPDVQRLNECDYVSATQGYSWQCVTARCPAVGSTCSAGIVNEYRVTDRQLARADSNVQ